MQFKYFFSIPNPFLQYSYFLVVFLLCTWFRSNIFLKGDPDSQGWGFIFVAMFSVLFILISIGAIDKVVFSGIPTLRKLGYILLLLITPFICAYFPFTASAHGSMFKLFIQYVSYLFIITGYYLFTSYIFLNALPKYLLVFTSVIVLFNLVMYAQNFYTAHMSNRILMPWHPYTWVEYKNKISPPGARQPAFDGNYFKFIQGNVRYPVEAYQNKEQGSVIVQFVIDKEGKITEIEFEQRVSPACDEEALRLINLMDGKWAPGTDESGKPIKYKIKLPVRFKI